MMDAKPRPNDREYIAILRRMTPEQRLKKAFELSAYAKRLFIHGLKQRHPELGPEEFHKLMLSELEKCHNRNY
jgi:hypothetical protein